MKLLVKQLISSVLISRSGFSVDKVVISETEFESLVFVIVHLVLASYVYKTLRLFEVLEN